MKNITFINAGAGSGKTYRLTTDLAAKLTSRSIAPSQVILTTYTELAAAEFREKARKEILKATTGTPQSRIEAATQLDNAYIGTVHAISYRFIRKYWYLLGYGADIQPMSDQNQDFYLSQSIHSIVSDEDRGVFREFRDAFDIKDGYGHPDHLFWLPELKSIVDKMEYYDIKDIKLSIKESCETAEKIFTGMARADIRTAIAKYLPLLKSRCTGLLGGRSAAKAQRIIDAIDNIGPNPTADALHTEQMKTILTETVGGTKDGFYNSTDYLNALSAYNQIAISRDHLEIVETYIRTIFGLAQRWREALLRYKQEKHIISFDDMEKLFLAMLTDPKYAEVQEDVKSNFRLLMVDEFQDSNPIQLKIFNRISDLINDGGGESVWVGDPKQAIYSFRGSDSRFISEILSKFQFDPDGKPLSKQGPDMLGTDQLTESWRSRPALVDFSNKVFLQPFKKSGLKDTQILLNPHFTAATDTMGNAPALYIWRTNKSNGKQSTKMLAAKIKELLNSETMVHHEQCDKPTSRITYHDIAVLCASNTDCDQVASQLRKLGLPVSCEETNLMQCLEVYLLKTLMLFVLNPSDKMVRAELTMMLEDASTEDILKDRIRYVNKNYAEGEKGWDKWMDNSHSVLTSLTERYKSLSIYDIVMAICEELDLGRLVEKWGDATQRRHNLATVANMAKAYDDMCLQMDTGSSIIGFINYLTITEPNVKTDNSANTIKVLTYHKSKGLEWPVVILYQLWKDFSNDQDIAKKQFRGANICEVVEDTPADIFERDHYVHLFPSKAGGTCTGTSNLPPALQTEITRMPLYATIKNRACEEALRLLYVGVTRAKDILISFTSSETNKSGNENLPSLWPSGLGIGNGASGAPFGDGFQGEIVELAENDAANNDEANSMYHPATNRPAINEAPSLSLSPSTLTEFDNPFTQNIQACESDERFIDMSIFGGNASDAVKGTCIHNIFAAYRQGDDEGNMRRTNQTLANFGFPSNGCGAQDIINSIEYLYEYLANQYGTATHIEQECPILYKLHNGQVLRGEIDLQWYYTDKDGQEKCILIDYKSFPGRRDELEKHTEKYYPQLSAYQAVLAASGVDVADTLVYYPVQGHIRKLLRQQ